MEGNDQDNNDNNQSLNTTEMSLQQSLMNNQQPMENKNNNNQSSVSAASQPRKIIVHQKTLKKSMKTFVDRTESELDRIQMDKLMANFQNIEDEQIKQDYFNHMNKDHKRIWKMKWPSIIVLVSRFMSRLRTQLAYTKPSLLTGYQLNTIGDKTSFFPQQLAKKQLVRKSNKQLVEEMIQLKKKKSFCSKLWSNFVKPFSTCMKSMKKCMRNCGESCIKCLDEKVPVFNPNSAPSIIWELIMTLFSLLYLLYLPLQFAFELTLERDNVGYRILFDVIGPLIFALNIFKKMNTSFYSNGSVKVGHYPIISHYMKTAFAFDLLIFVFLGIREWVLQQQLGITWALFLIYNIKNDIFQVFRKNLILNEVSLAFLNLLFLVLRLLYFLHLTCCLWIAVGKHEMVNDNEGWLVRIGYENASSKEIYIYAFFFCIVQASTIKSALPQYSDEERLFMIGMAFCMCIGYGYTIGSIVAMVKAQSQKRGEYLRKLDQLNKYCEFHKVDDDIRKRSQKYLEKEYQKSLQVDISSKTSINNLSEDLKQEVKTNIYYQTLKRMPVFKDKFSDDLLKKLAPYVVEHQYKQGDTILKDNNKEQETRIYFICQGTVQLQLKIGKDDTKQFSQVKQSQSFGVQQFFEDIPYYYTAISYTSTYLHSIAKKDFMEVLKSYPLERDIYCFIRDQLVLSKNYSIVEDTCFSCQQQNHTVINCPYLTYQDKFKALNTKTWRQMPQYRDDNFVRHREHKINPILNLRFIQWSLGTNQKKRVRKNKNIDQILEQSQNQDIIADQLSNPQFNQQEFKDDYVYEEEFKEGEEDDYDEEEDDYNFDEMADVIDNQLKQQESIKPGQENEHIKYKLKYQLGAGIKQRDFRQNAQDKKNKLDQLAQVLSEKKYHEKHMRKVKQKDMGMDIDAMLGNDLSYDQGKEIQTARQSYFNAQMETSQQFIGSRGAGLYSRQITRQSFLESGNRESFYSYCRDSQKYQ